MADQDKRQSEGRNENAAQPKGLGTSQATPEAYPSASADDGVERGGRLEQVTGERRSFDNANGNPAPRQGAGDGSAPAATTEGRMGPQGDPAEGKR
jgi:hypothetical protein